MLDGARRELEEGEEVGLSGEAAEAAAFLPDLALRVEEAAAGIVSILLLTGAFLAGAGDAWFGDGEAYSPQALAFPLSSSACITAPSRAVSWMGA